MAGARFRGQQVPQLGFELSLRPVQWLTYYQPTATVVGLGFRATLVTLEMKCCPYSSLPTLDSAQSRHLQPHACLEVLPGLVSSFSLVINLVHVRLSVCSGLGFPSLSPSSSQQTLKFSAFQSVKIGLGGSPGPGCLPSPPASPPPHRHLPAATLVSVLFM